MGWFWKPPRAAYRVVVHLDGRHPYLKGNELDYETRDVELTVPARSWNDAANVALEASFKMAAWSYSVRSISLLPSEKSP
jgi:hypothetical protein